MAKNFEIILNMDKAVTMADGTKHKWSIDEAIDICNEHNCKWICAPHVPDDMSNFNHWHLGIHTTSNNTYETIAKWFKLPTNSVQAIRTRFESTYALYIVHYNQEGKTPVDFEKVRSNCNIDYNKLIGNIKNANRLDEILEKIDDGTIREYNYYNHMTSVEYVRYERQIKKAWEYRKDRLRGVDRSMKCVFIQGDSGVGKTTYAKIICKENKYTTYVSSGSNDVLDDYKGEDAIILDDLRPNCLSLSDLLKMLDNNTASSVKSRFKNKVLECKMIIITTTKDIETFFHEVFQNENETKIQLMRRCELYIKMHKKDMDLYLYNQKTREYEYLHSIENPVYAEYAVEEMTPTEKLAYVGSILGNTGTILSKVSDGIKEGKFVNAKPGEVPFT